MLAHHLRIIANLTWSSIGANYARWLHQRDTLVLPLVAPNCDTLGKLRGLAASFVWTKVAADIPIIDSY